MSFVVDTLNDEVRLEGDAFGACSERIQMPAAPAGAKKMQFVFRTWIDTVSASVVKTACPWNHTNCFGLSFAGARPKYPSVATAGSTTYRAPDFFGWHSTGPQSHLIDRVNQELVTVGGKALVNTGGNISGSVQGMSFTNGNTSSPASAFALTGYNNWYTIGSVGNGTDSQHGVPANPTAGATFTGYWEVYASALNRSMYTTLGTNFDSLAGSAMFNARASLFGSGSFQPVVDHMFLADAVSAWRPDFDTVVFPRWLVMRFSWPDKKFVLKHARVRYLNYDDDVLGEEVLP